MARLHEKVDINDPAWRFYGEIIDAINVEMHCWREKDGLTDAGRIQAIASALMAQTVHTFMNYWGVTKEQFMQMAEEEWDLRTSSRSELNSSDALN